ncbi:serine palmitoyl transferase subunit [Tritrichomonas foetus]|uniref:serine C-palmitoyltransferase n=1 Tax=Tritrichomonas foetus TaxID=1144522 RepID=A0A1J4JQL5_9EUKA|nr:serine palmitoyl transferase subunit [Tritrichomonas foetus]|eukprot:OHT01050.1 serine palmitoyl transferase subunit [Tritrichomonas foetus]
MNDQNIHNSSIERSIMIQNNSKYSNTFSQNMITSFEDWLSSLWFQSPIHLLVELLLVSILIVLLLRPPEPIHDPKDDLTVEEEDQIISDWKPKPLIPEIPEDTIDPGIISNHTITSGPSDTIEIDGKKMINFGTPNFYGLNMNKEIVDAALAAIDRYAVGACGPRQFYGTMDAHLEVEKEMANFLGTEDSVNYCYIFATTTSVIQAFVHNSDIVFVDDGSWFAVKLGAELTRSRIVPFKHNDMNDLREKIIHHKKTFQRWPKCNRWVVGEGLYANDGSIWDLQQIVQLRKEFCLRIIIDETLSIGSLGEKGRGLCEHFGVPRSLVEVSIGSYGSSFASLGGFTIGTKDFCAHQRLASHAYIFSASPPCFNVVAATKALQIVEKDGEERIKKLRENTLLMRNELNGIESFEVVGSEQSPLIHLRLKEPLESFHTEDELLQKIVEACIDSENPVAITKSKFVRMKDMTAPHPSLKIFVSAAHSEEHIKTAVATIKNAISQNLN